jgi:hypothetical protein
MHPYRLECVRHGPLYMSFAGGHGVETLCVLLFASFVILFLSLTCMKKCAEMQLSVSAHFFDMVRYGPLYNILPLTYYIIHLVR